MAGKRLVELLDERAKNAPEAVRAISDEGLSALIDEDIAPSRRPLHEGSRHKNRF